MTPEQALLQVIAELQMTNMRLRTSLSEATQELEKLRAAKEE